MSGFQERRLGKPNGVSPPAHTPDAYPCSKCILSGSWPCSSWIQMTSEECGWRIPGAYPVSKEDCPRQPMGASSSAHTWAHTSFPWGSSGATADAAEGFVPCANRRRRLARVIRIRGQTSVPHSGAHPRAHTPAHRLEIIPQGIYIYIYIRRIPRRIPFFIYIVPSGPTVIKSASGWIYGLAHTWRILESSSAIFLTASASSARFECGRVEESHKRKGGREKEKERQGERERDEE